MALAKAVCRVKFKEISMRFGIRSSIRETREGKGKQRAQGLVEFAIILPILLLVLFAIIEMARILHAWLVVENGARVGIRFAVTGEYDPTHCDNGVTDDKCSLESDVPKARVKSIHDAAWAGSSSIVRVGMDDGVAADAPSYFDVVVCEPENLIQPSSTFDNHGCAPDEYPGEPDEHVVVVVDFNHPLILPGLSNIWPTLRLTARREAIVEGYRIPKVGGFPTPIDTPEPHPTRTVAATSTITPIPSPTQQPSCSLISIRDGLEWDSTDELEIEFRNSNPMDAYLTYFRLEISNYTGSPPAYIDHIDFNHDGDIWDGAEYFSSQPFIGPYSWLRFEDDSREDIEVDIDRPYQPIYGTFRVEVHFDFPDWNGGPCVFIDEFTEENPPTRTPRPTSTQGPTRTPRPTRTEGPTETPGPTRTPRPTKTATPPGQPTRTPTQPAPTTPTMTPTIGPPPDD
jgi:hypothetical protein